MDNILKKKERERRKEIPVWFEVNLRKPNSKTYAELDFTSLCEDKDIVDNLASDDDTCSSVSESEYYNEKGQVREFIASDLMAKGIGYDINDQFIDDTDTHVPPPANAPSLAPYYGGFFVNFGQIRIKDDDQSEDEVVSEPEVEVKQTKKKPNKANASPPQPKRMVGQPPSVKSTAQPPTKSDGKTQSATAKPTKESRMMAQPPTSRMTGRPPTKKGKSGTQGAPILDSSDDNEEPSSSKAIVPSTSNEQPIVSPVKTPKKAKRSHSPSNDTAPPTKRIKSPMKTKRKLSPQKDDVVKKPRKPRQSKKQKNVDGSITNSVDNHQPSTPNIAGDNQLLNVLGNAINLIGSPKNGSPAKTIIPSVDLQPKDTMKHPKLTPKAITSGDSNQTIDQSTSMQSSNKSMPTLSGQPVRKQYKPRKPRVDKQQTNKPETSTRSVDANKSTDVSKPQLTLDYVVKNVRKLPDGNFSLLDKTLDVSTLKELIKQLGSMTTTSSNSSTSTNVQQEKSKSKANDKQRVKKPVQSSNSLLSTPKQPSSNYPLLSQMQNVMTMSNLLKDQMTQMQPSSKQPSTNKSSMGTNQIQKTTPTQTSNLTDFQNAMSNLSKSQKTTPKQQSTPFNAQPVSSMTNHQMQNVMNMSNLFKDQMSQMQKMASTAPSKQPSTIAEQLSQLHQMVAAHAANMSTSSPANPKNMMTSGSTSNEHRISNSSSKQPSTPSTSIGQSSLTTTSSPFKQQATPFTLPAFISQPNLANNQMSQMKRMTSTQANPTPPKSISISTQNASQLSQLKPEHSQQPTKSPIFSTVKKPSKGPMAKMVASVHQTVKNPVQKPTHLSQPNKAHPTIPQAYQTPNASSSIQQQSGNSSSSIFKSTQQTTDLARTPTNLNVQAANLALSTSSSASSLDSSQSTAVQKLIEEQLKSSVPNWNRLPENMRQITLSQYYTQYLTFMNPTTSNNTVKK